MFICTHCVIWYMYFNIPMKLIHDFGTISNRWQKYSHSIMCSLYICINRVTKFETATSVSNSLTKHKMLIYNSVPCYECFRLYISLCSLISIQNALQSTYIYIITLFSSNWYDVNGSFNVHILFTDILWRLYSVRLP